MATISIIIPVYNAERFLAFTLNSILKQSYQEFEVLLVDDGSTDSSSIICDEYAEKDNRFKVTHINNAGVSHARNIGISLASGEYLFFCDADDMLHPDALNILYNTIQEELCDMVFSNRVFIKNEDTPFLADVVTCTRYRYEDENGLKKLYFDHPECFTVVWGKLYKANYIRNEYIKFNEKISRGEDVLFICSYITGLCRSVVYVNSLLYNYREVQGSLSRSEDDTLIMQSLEKFVSYESFIKSREVPFEISRLIKSDIAADVINCVLNSKLNIKELVFSLSRISSCHYFMRFVHENSASFTRAQRIFIFLINFASKWIVTIFVKIYQSVKK